jgi:hypothetical protein
MLASKPIKNLKGTHGFRWIAISYTPIIQAIHPMTGISGKERGTLSKKTGIEETEERDTISTPEET